MMPTNALAGTMTWSDDSDEEAPVAKKERVEPLAVIKERKPLMASVPDVTQLGRPSSSPSRKKGSSRRTMVRRPRSPGSSDEEFIPLAQRPLNLLPDDFEFTFDLLPPLLRVPDWARLPETPAEPKKSVASREQDVPAPEEKDNGKAEALNKKIEEDKVAAPVVAAESPGGLSAEEESLLPKDDGPPLPERPHPVVPEYVLENVENENPLDGHTDAAAPLDATATKLKGEDDGGALPGTPVVRAKMYGLERPELPSTPLPPPPPPEDDDDDGSGVASTSGDTEEEADVVERLQSQIEGNEITEQEQYALTIAKEAIMASPMTMGGPASAAEEKKERRSASWRKSWRKDDQQIKKRQDSNK